MRKGAVAIIFDMHSWLSSKSDSNVRQCVDAGSGSSICPHAMNMQVMVAIAVLLVNRMFLNLER